MNDLQQSRQLIIAKCWADEAFKQQLIADPLGTLKLEGIEPAPGMTINVMENTDAMVHLVIPAIPSDLGDELLSRATGGFYSEGGDSAW